MTVVLTLAEYVTECKRLFNTDRCGWSVWEQEIAFQGWSDGNTTQEAVYRMNDSWVRRLANRNV